MSQTDDVLALLRQRGPKGLTPLEALELIGTMRLASRINEARELLRRREPDLEIVTGSAIRGDKRFARYVLRRRVTRGVEQQSLW